MYIPFSISQERLSKRCISSNEMFVPPDRLLRFSYSFALSLSLSLSFSLSLSLSLSRLLFRRLPVSLTNVLLHAIRQQNFNVIYSLANLHENSSRENRKKAITYVYSVAFCCFELLVNAPKNTRQCNQKRSN